MLNRDFDPLIKALRKLFYILALLKLVRLVLVSGTGKVNISKFQDLGFLIKNFNYKHYVDSKFKPKNI